MECIDLLALYGYQYHVSHDEADDCQGDPWYYTIPAANGIIYPHGGIVLAVEIDGHTAIARKVSEIPGVVIHQDGDQEKTLLFDVSLFDQVAALVKPRKRRHLSPEHRQALLSAGAEFLFKPTPKDEKENS